MFPKEFIKHVLINELEEITKSNAYISFALIGIGIEFLGKCMDSKATSWNIKGRSKNNFEFPLVKMRMLNSLMKHTFSNESKNYPYFLNKGKKI